MKSLIYSAVILSVLAFTGCSASNSVENAADNIAGDINRAFDIDGDGVNEKVSSGTNNGKNKFGEGMIGAENITGNGSYNESRNSYDDYTLNENSGDVLRENAGVNSSPTTSVAMSGE